MLAALVIGCAPRSGWQRTEQRTCAPAEPPRVCVSAEPDRQLVVRAGGEELVPGECMVAPRRRGGRLQVHTFDGASGERTTRWIGVRRGRVTGVALGDRGAAVVGRADCSLRRG